MIKKTLLWIYFFPQHLLAISLIFLYKNILKRKVVSFNINTLIELNYNPEVKVYYIENFPNKKTLSGISLSKYIILDKRYLDFSSLKKRNFITVKHEFGHVKQSFYFGWFYLIIIGIPSIVQNLFSWRQYKKGNYYFYKRYYNRYPEKWADKLGNVTRKERLEDGWIVS